MSDWSEVPKVKLEPCSGCICEKCEAYEGLLHEFGIAWTLLIRVKNQYEDADLLGHDLLRDVKNWIEK